MRYLFPLSPYNQQRQFEKPVWVYPAHLAAYATYLRNHGDEVIWEYDDKKECPDKLIHDIRKDICVYDDSQIDVPFEKLPYPDRIFTDAKNPRWQKYGNYQVHPATHMMASNKCWYGKCAFCHDSTIKERYCRTVDSCMEEIDDCIRLGFKEIFDDSGTFPYIGKQMDEFCFGMMLNNRRHKIKIGCNMRLQEADWTMMKDAGFRMILIGIESANYDTLQKIKKGITGEGVLKILKHASEAGLEPHGTFMTGYPWETEKDEQRTIELCHSLLKKGYLKTAQASVYSLPRQVADPNSNGHRYINEFYSVYKDPQFILRKLSDIRRWEDFTYLIRGARLVLEEKWRKS